MRHLTILFILMSLLLSAAIFGFFYAWVCSTMWGLDATDPGVAIQAMQAMNGSVRNIVFAPAFFGTPIVLAITAGLLWRQSMRQGAALFALSSAIYFCFGLILTMRINVPMNEALALLEIPADPAQSKALWQQYSQPWQFWNQARTIASGVSFALAAYATLLLDLTRRT